MVAPRKAPLTGAASGLIYFGVTSLSLLRESRTPNGTSRPDAHVPEHEVPDPAPGRVPRRHPKLGFGPCLRRGVDYDHRYGAVVKHRRRNRAE
jgi:hypothetical protein